MNVRRLTIALPLLAVLMLPGAAPAAQYDLTLGRYMDAQCDFTCAQSQFEDLMVELGQITAPVFLSPAETLGLNGFAIGFEGSIAPISKDEAFWTDATEGNPGSVLFIPHIHVRKGIPFSFEIGTQLSMIPNSELFMVGAELKWALNEGFHYIPDLAVRIAINHVIGGKEFELTSGGWDVSISKAFGVAGMLALTPYAGYNMMFVHASSHVMLADVDGDDVFENYVFSEVNWQDNMFHRFFVGLRLTTFIFQVVAEGTFTLDGVSMFNFKVGLDY